MADENGLVEVRVEGETKGEKAKKRKTKKDDSSAAEEMEPIKKSKKEKKETPKPEEVEDVITGYCTDQHRMMYEKSETAQPNLGPFSCLSVSQGTVSTFLTGALDFVNIISPQFPVWCSIKRLNAFARDPENIENGTRLVLMQFYLHKVEHINTTEQTCHIEFGLTHWWKSEEIVGKWGDEWDYKKEVKFWPELEFSGVIKVKKLLEDHGSVWINECFTAHGIMNNYQRWKAILHIPMKLHDFPFDQQVIKMRINSWAWGKDSMVVDCVNPDASLMAMSEQLHELVEWTPVETLSIRQHDFWDPCDERWVSAMTVYIPLRRLTWFYISNIFAMGFMLSLLGLAACFISPDLIADRLVYTVTLLLAAIAFNFVVSDYLPKANYGNYLTEFFFIIYLFLGTEVLETVINGLIVRFQGNGAPTTRAYNLDWCTIGVLGFFQLCYVFRILYLARIRKHGAPNYEGEEPESCCMKCCCHACCCCRAEEELPLKKWN